MNQSLQKLRTLTLPPILFTAMPKVSYDPVFVVDTGESCTLPLYPALVTSRICVHVPPPFLPYTR
jgi:hypothetical protein